mmetsp:Transcript_10159/g.22005  ORF Transcript_10159/g.22005 Transcript_10159/m.22005 type:complete len:271 (+) Transcript_10159:935-1747(+)
MHHLARLLVHSAFEHVVLRRVKQVGQPHHVSRARLEGLAIRPVDGAEADVLEARARLRPPRLLGRGEDELEMRALPRVDDVEHPIALLLKQPVPDGSHVGRVVVVAAVALDQDERVLLLGVLGEDELGAGRVVLDLADLVEVGDDRRDEGVVEGLAHLVQLGAHAEARVDLLKFAPRDLTDLFPRAERGRVSGLQAHHLLVSEVLELLVLVEDLLGVAVELLQVGDGRRLGCEVGEDPLQVANEHAELGAPVPDVVDALDFVAAELEDAC